VLVSSIGGGIEVKLLDQNMTIDLSDTAFKELVAGYIRKDFRDLVFKS
jgi:V/A-type H+-transporting ATPase subunit E